MRDAGQGLRHNENPVDEDFLDSDRLAKRESVRGTSSDRIGIEYNHVSKITDGDPSSAGQSEKAGRDVGNPSDRFRQGRHFPLTHAVAEELRKGTPAARMRSAV